MTNGAAGGGPAPRIAIVAYGMGNLRSVEKALARVGAVPDVTSDHARLRAAAGVVLPGVGAFPEAMAAIRRQGLDELLAETVAAGTPVLGICLGMQLLFDSSVEHGGAEGLGLIAGPVRPIGGDGLKRPQIGWTRVTWRRPSALGNGWPRASASYYHVHSFAPVPRDDGDVLATAVYGQEFATAVGRGNLFGVQFHPEKSGPDGLRVLAGFAAACG